MQKKLLLLTVFLFSCFIHAQTFNAPMNLTQCSTTQTATFDLTVNINIVLSNAGPQNFNVTFHHSESDANTGANPITNPTSYVNVTSPEAVFMRMVNIVTTGVTIWNFSLSISNIMTANGIDWIQCDNDSNNSDGFTTINLDALYQHIIDSNPNYSNLTISLYETLADAQNTSNPIGGNIYSNISANFQTIFYTAQNSSGCSAIGQIYLFIQSCSQECLAPINLTVSQIIESSAVLSWSIQGSEFAWEVYLSPAGAPAPTAATAGISVATNPYVVTGLECSSAYVFYVRSICSATSASSWSGPRFFESMGCDAMGQPENLAECAENGQACFNLTVNNANTLGNLNPADYTITYHTTQTDATSGTNAIGNATSFCLPVTASETTIFLRIRNNETGNFSIFTFNVTAQEVIAGTIAIQQMTQCDDDNDGIVIFDLTAAAAQLNTANTLTYYSDSENATAGTNAIASPTNYPLNIANSNATIFIRENVVGSCDIIHSFQINAQANCNIATVCAAANSLCNALGVPFNNSQNISAQVGNDYQCLGTQPNPTWFYIPVSVGGQINLTIQQNTSINFNGLPLDVDYICYGPFTNPVTPCSGLLTAVNTVACSYSASATETVSIANAQAGKFYLIMVTNFSNQPGFIRIDQTAGTGSGAIDCTGLKLNAFLDNNSNGTKDSGEQDFILGQFHYERNNDSNIHNITSPSGIYNIYDLNDSNAYNLSFTIDPIYSANYSVTTAAYNNIHVIAGGGMQTYYFPVTVTQGYSDLTVSIIPQSAPRPGFTYANIIRYTNMGSQTVSSGTVTFTKDPSVTITSNTQSGTVAIANGFTYVFTNLLPFESREMTVTMQVPTNAVLGSSLVSNANVVPLAGDLSPENNTSTSSQVVIGSYDPNDKMESRGENILISNFTNQDYLYYTIRFENTGTASAINVKILDALDSKLDETSVKMVDASYNNYILDRVGNLLTWKLDNIQLPTTTQDPTGGKGFLHFKVKPKPGYAVGDIIQNTASIFFDFNAAIITNTFNTHFVNALSTAQFSADAFTMYPNPAGDHVTVSVSGNSHISQIAIYDMLGKTILRSKPATAGETETIDVSAISSGIYFLEVTAGTSETVKKLVIK